MLKGETKLYKHPNARTIYLSIPSSIACDSQFPFKVGDVVTIEYSISNKQIIIKKKDE